jgi:hypothetical protein
VCGLGPLASSGGQSRGGGAAHPPPLDGVRETFLQARQQIRIALDRDHARRPLGERRGERAGAWTDLEDRTALGCGRGFGDEAGRVRVGEKVLPETLLRKGRATGRARCGDALAAFAGRLARRLGFRRAAALTIPQHQTATFALGASSLAAPGLP